MNTSLSLIREKISEKSGYYTFCVPLSVNHPYPRAFQFFEINGYRKTGSIKWIADEYKKESDLVNGLCPVHNKKPEVKAVAEKK